MVASDELRRSRLQRGCLRHLRGPVLRGLRSLLQWGPVMALRLPPDLPEVLKADRVASLFQVDPKSVARWARSGKLTGFRSPSGSWLFRRAEVERFLNSGGRP